MALLINTDIKIGNQEGNYNLFNYLSCLIIENTPIYTHREKLWSKFTYQRHLSKLLIYYTYIFNLLFNLSPSRAKRGWGRDLYNFENDCGCTHCGQNSPVNSSKSQIIEK